MKNRLPIFILLAVFLMITLGQTILVSPSSSPDDYQAVFTITDLDSLEPNLPKYEVAPYYQMFFIYGDGNYYWRTKEMYPNASPPPPHESTHSYLNCDGQYFPFAIAIDRKTDNPPPRQIIIVNDSSLHINPASPFTPPDMINLANKSPALIDYIDPENLLTNPQRIRLDFSHFFERGRKSSFIVAYHPILGDFPNRTPGNTRILFFPQFIALSADSSQTHAPYYGIRSPGEFSNAKIEPDSNYRDIPAMYEETKNNVLIYDIPGNNFLLDDWEDSIEELRIFHVVHSVGQEDSTYTFMAVLVSDVQPNQALAQSNYQVDSGYLENFVDPISQFSLYNESTHSVWYYLDADTIQLRSGKPKDPNHLWVSDICKRSAKEDEFAVTFSLQFCNTSPIPSTSASVFIHDIDGDSDFYCIKPVEGKMGLGKSGNVVNPNTCGKQKRGACGNCHTLNNTCQEYNFCENCHAQFCLTYDAIAKERRSPGNECRTFSFTVCTNREGLRKLDHLRACVTFHDTDCEQVCASLNKKSYPDLQPVLDRIDPVICEDPSICENCNQQPKPRWPQWVAGLSLAAAVTVAVIYAVRYLRRRRRERS